MSVDPLKSILDVYKYTIFDLSFTYKIIKYEADLVKLSHSNDSFYSNEKNDIPLSIFSIILYICATSHNSFWVFGLI